MTRRNWAALIALAAFIVLPAPQNAIAEPAPPGAEPPHTPRAVCGPGSMPESGRQGRVPLSEVQSGRAAKGYSCNMELISRFGQEGGSAGAGGYKVFRYVDAAGHECAYYDSTLLFPLGYNESSGNLGGVYVLDMSNPAKPVKTTNLLTPAMQSPHETLQLNAKRGLLVAVSANPVFYPGVVDVYDVTRDCRFPDLKASVPVVGLGHESGFSPDGRTLYIASLFTPTVTAVDLTNPSLPTTLWVGSTYETHGIGVSEDGNRIYLTTYKSSDASASTRGLAILDTTEVQARRINPQVRQVSFLTWNIVSTPQIALPISIKGHPYLIELDEFARSGNINYVGAGRIIDIADDRKPFVVSHLRLEVNQTANQPSQLGDPGYTTPDGGLQGYAGHYCSVPTPVDPEVVACTFIVSGMRLFDIRDPFNPKEIAYFNGPIQSPTNAAPNGQGGAYAMSAPAFAPERGEIWYTDGNSGFYAVRVTNGVWPFPAVGAEAQPAGKLAATGSGRRILVLAGVLLVLSAIGVLALHSGTARRLS